MNVCLLRAKIPEIDPLLCSRFSKKTARRNPVGYLKIVAGVIVAITPIPEDEIIFVRHGLIVLAI